MRAYTQHIAILLLAVISAFIVPKELVHAFYDHTDTIHTEHHSDTNLPVVESEHQHCEILNFNVPLYFHSLHFSPLLKAAYLAVVSEHAVQHFAAPAFRLFSLRGPPSC